MIDMYPINSRREIALMGHLSPLEVTTQEARECYDKATRDIMRGEIVPDEGTLEDLKWITTYREFGEVISRFNPRWGRCCSCNQYRLGFTSMRDLSHTCYKCSIKEKVIRDAEDLKNLDTDIVKNFLNEGVVDPTIGWKTFQEIFDEETKRIVERMHAKADLDPFFPLKDKDRNRMIEQMLNGL